MLATRDRHTDPQMKVWSSRVRGLRFRRVWAPGLLRSLGHVLQHGKRSFVGVWGKGFPGVDVAHAMRVEMEYGLRRGSCRPAIVHGLLPRDGK